MWTNFLSENYDRLRKIIRKEICRCLGIPNGIATLDENGQVNADQLPDTGGQATTDASALTSGTLSDARLSANVPVMTSGVLPVVSGANLTGVVKTVGAVGSTPNANGATIASEQLILQPVNTLQPGVMLAAHYNRIFGKASVTWGAGTVIVSISNRQHDVTVSTTGARTLQLTNTGNTLKVTMYINNTSGATFVLTLPSNSFVLNNTSRIYESAANVTILQGRTILDLVNYDGTNYWFTY